MAERKYILGIDQGSSKTHALIGDACGSILGFGQSRGACHSSTGIDSSMEAVAEALNQAALEAKIKLEEIGILVAGLTGVDWEFEAALLEQELRKRTGIEQIHVVNDCLIAMRAGTKKTYGAVLCAGSGLNCAVRDEKGNEFVYGFYIDEEFQGGTALGKACVRAVIDGHTGIGEKTALTEIVLEKFRCRTVDELLYKKVTGVIGDREFLQLPIYLDQAATEGDLVAKGILHRFGRQFGQYVSAGVKKIKIDMAIDVVLSGSIFKCKSPELRQGVREYLEEETPMAKLVDGIYEPIVGAYLMGLDLVSADKSFEDDEKIMEECRKYQLFRNKDTGENK